AQLIKVSTGVELLCPVPRRKFQSPNENSPGKSFKNCYCCCGMSSRAAPTAVCDSKKPLLPLLLLPLLLLVTGGAKAAPLQFSALSEAPARDVTHEVSVRAVGKRSGWLVQVRDKVLLFRSERDAKAFLSSHYHHLWAVNRPRFG
ncbi:hypothetical protein BOX15_Mlig032973g2, partial [Macrostomum lignano]